MRKNERKRRRRKHRWRWGVGRKKTGLNRETKSRKVMIAGPPQLNPTLHVFHSSLAPDKTIIVPYTELRGR